MLTTLAAGHPLAATRIGFRGLPASVAGTLPAHDTAEALAADILEMIDSPAKLAERRRLVCQARDAIGPTTDLAALVMTMPLPTGPATRERQAQWSLIIGKAPVSDKSPYYFRFALDFPMSGTDWDREVLLGGWHEPEPWGRWTDGADAALQVTLAEPSSEPLTLELDIVPSAVGANLRVGVDGTTLPLIDPVPGLNGWDVPAELTNGKTSFLVTLHVGETVCPARNSGSPDDRILGIGVSAVRLLSRQPTLCVLNTSMQLRASAMPRGVLLTGWHGPEDWGCWSSKTTASLRLTLGEPIQATLRLEMDLSLPPDHPILTLSVNNVRLPATTPADGANSWDLPPQATNGRTELVLLLTVPETFCGARTGETADDRELGIGLRRLRLVPLVSTFYELGTDLKLTTDAAVEEALLKGWHALEVWGCWTSQRDAVLRLALRQKLFGPFRLEMDLMPLPPGSTLTLSVNGTALPAIEPVEGTNRWNLPESVINDQQTLLIGLGVADMFCPADFADSADTRVLGVGVRRLALHRNAAALCPIGTLIRFSSEGGDRGMLLSGWHKPEPWGRWSSGSEASMLLRFDAPLEGPYALEFELTPPLLDPSVTLSVDDAVLDTITVLDGPSEWILPRDRTDGRTALQVGLLVARPARPMDVKASRDDRFLGVGVRSLRMRAIREA